MNVLAIDQGTSATKAIVVAPGARILGRGCAPVSPRAGTNGSVIQDPGALLRSVLDAGRQAMAEAQVEVDAIGLGNQGETAVYEPSVSADEAEERLASWRSAAEALAERRLQR